MRSRSPVLCLDAKDGSILGEISSSMFQVDARCDHAPGLFELDTSAFLRRSWQDGPFG